MAQGSSPVALGTAVPSLVRWGKSADADLVLRMLSSYGPHSAPELGKELGLSAKRIGDALEELRAAGAVRVASRGARQRRHLIWSARPPAEVLAALRRQRAQLTRPAPTCGPDESLDQLLDRLRLLRGPDVTHLASRALTSDRLHELFAVEKHEHLAMNTEQVFDDEAYRRGTQGQESLLGRGVQIRIIGRPPPNDYPAPDDHVPPGTGYRLTPTVPRKLFVVDRRIALVPLDPRNHVRGYLETSQALVVEALVSEFDRCWGVARDPMKGALSALTLSERERRLITLLAHGHTDASAARRLRISERSVTNVLRKLMDRTATYNRFQLGLKLGSMKVAAPPQDRD